LANLNTIWISTFAEANQMAFVKECPFWTQVLEPHFFFALIEGREDKRK
jgi:hypothetical protein